MPFSSPATQDKSQSRAKSGVLGEWRLMAALASLPIPEGTDVAPPLYPGGSRIIGLGRQ